MEAISWGIALSRHDMGSLSFFEGNPVDNVEEPLKGPIMQSVGVFFVSLNKLLKKQSGC